MHYSIIISDVILYKIKLYNFFTQLKLCLATATHNSKWVKNIWKIIC